MKTNYRILANNTYQNNNTYETGINNNDLIIGPSGAGKTRNYVKPNIMQCNESLIIADTKGNLIKQVGPLLKEKGYQIKIIDYKNITKSHGYNPFDFIGYNNETKQYNCQDILTISSTLVPQENSKDPFWDLAARMYLTCLISYTLECLPKEEHNLESIYELLTIIQTSVFDNLIFQLEIENPKSFAVKQYKMFKNNRQAEKMNQSIIGILFEKINELTNNDICTLYHNNKKISFEELSTTKTAIFLTISDTDRSMDKLASLFYKQALQSLCTIADNNPSSRLDIPVRFIFDDFATNTIIPDFDNIISVIRSREIYVSIILQSITQLNALYGKEKAITIINNCDNCLYLGGQDVTTAEFCAIKANKPIQEILEMPIDRAYLFTRGNKPLEVSKFDITKHDYYDLLPEASFPKIKQEPDSIHQENTYQI
ncbi:VirD4-like conjugal transfer protein, CD1115 family [Tannockella kyphosi]|uniref:VirD4-like conjugal transfer protein, CD1115 family n=1 Tax=Tannockella kyphosi TaxID=2899121 RepID=UPI002011785A|nr:type IV secretory system conjugative DNA transfer family protein [Tannockella kyphosi]